MGMDSMLVILLFLFFTLYFIISGFILIINRNKEKNERKRREEVCTVRANGRIVDIDLWKEGIKHPYFHFHYIYEFEANGRVYTEKSYYEFARRAFESAKKIIQAPIGSETEIFYNSNDPTEFYVKEEPDGEKTAKDKVAVGILNILIGLFFLSRLQLLL